LYFKKNLAFGGKKISGNEILKREKKLNPKEISITTKKITFLSKNMRNNSQSLAN